MSNYLQYRCNNSTRRRRSGVKIITPKVPPLVYHGSVELHRELGVHSGMCNGNEIRQICPKYVQVIARQWIEKHFKHTFSWVNTRFYRENHFQIRTKLKQVQRSTSRFFIFFLRVLRSFKRQPLFSTRLKRISAGTSATWDRQRVVRTEIGPLRPILSYSPRTRVNIMQLVCKYLKRKFQNLPFFIFPANPIFLSAPFPLRLCPKLRIFQAETGMSNSDLHVCRVFEQSTNSKRGDVCICFSLCIIYVVLAC